MEQPRSREQDAMQEMTIALELIRYIIRSEYKIDNATAQRVRRIGEEMKNALIALKLDYYNRNGGSNQ